MFSLPMFTKVTLMHFAVRAELHGSDPVPAGDIRIRLSGSNKMLDMFEPGLRHALYRAADGADDDQPDLDGVDPVSDTPALRSSLIAMPIHLNREYPGRNVVLDYGMGGKSNIELSGDINSFKIDAKDGGSVDIDFRIQVSGLDEKALGRLGMLVKHNVEITIAASAEADNTQEQLPGATPFKFTVAPEGGIFDNSPAAGQDEGPAAGFEAATAAVLAEQHSETKQKRGKAH